MKSAGFTNTDQLYIAGHSLGTVMIQNYTIKHVDMFQGQILMGGSLLRDTRSYDFITGKTQFAANVIPTLTLAGTKDGMYRISRNAETYFHNVKNIIPEQAGRHPVALLKGVGHGSFMDEDMIPDLVMKQDLKADVDQATGYKMVAQNLVSFVLKIKGDHEQSVAALGDFKDEAEEYFKPFLEGMRLEGSYHIRRPCYSSNLMNPDTPNECMKGAPWVHTAQAIMGGDLTADHVTIQDTDNFHRVYTPNK